MYQFKNVFLVLFLLMSFNSIGQELKFTKSWKYSLKLAAKNKTRIVLFPSSDKISNNKNIQDLLKNKEFIDLTEGFVLYQVSTKDIKNLPKIVIENSKKLTLLNSKGEIENNISDCLECRKILFYILNQD